VRDTRLTVADRAPQAGDELRTDPELAAPLRIVVRAVDADGTAFGLATRPWSLKVVVPNVILPPEQIAADRRTYYTARADGGPVTKEATPNG
jgi:hypothetical protein